MQYTYGAQPTSTNNAYAFNGGTSGVAQPPPIPTGNPFNQQQGFQQNQFNMAQPQMYWGQLGYAQEPTMVDVIADLVRDNEDTATFFAEGGFEALSTIIAETVDLRLKEFFTGMKMVQQKGEDGVTTISYSIELSSEESKAIASKSKVELTAAIQGISSSVKEKLLQPRSQTASLHRQAASAQAAQGMIGGMLAESMAQPNGVGQKLAGTAGGLLRSTLGLPPAPQNRGGA